MVSASIADGWRAFRRAPSQFLGAIMLVLAISAFAYGINLMVPHGGAPTLAYIPLATIAWWLSLPMAFLPGYLALNIVRGNDVGFASVLVVCKRFFPLAGTIVLTTVTVSLGNIVIALLFQTIMETAMPLSEASWTVNPVLFGVLAVLFFVTMIGFWIVVGLGLMQAPMLVIDKGFGALDALRGSWAMMSGYKLDAFLLGLASLAIIALGILALGVGLLVAVPVVLAAGAAFYDRVLAANPPPQLDLLPPADPLLAA